MGTPPQLCICRSMARAHKSKINFSRLSVLDRRAKVMGIAYHEFIISTTGGDYKNPSFFLITHNSKVGVRDRNIWLKYKGFWHHQSCSSTIHTLEPPNNMTHYCTHTKMQNSFVLVLPVNICRRSFLKKNSWGGLQATTCFAQKRLYFFLIIETVAKRCAVRKLNWMILKRTGFFQLSKPVWGATPKQSLCWPWDSRRPEKATVLTFWCLLKPLFNAHCCLLVKVHTRCAVK